MAEHTSSLTARPDGSSAAADDASEAAPAAETHAPRKAPLLSWRRITTPSAILIATLVAGNVLRIANTMVLTRLLAPSDFGIAGMILSVFFVVAMVTDVGFQAFIVRHERGDEPAFLDAVWSLHISRGFINSTAIVLLSVPIAHLLAKPELAPLLAVASLTLAIDGTSSLTLLTSLRRGLVRRLSMVDFGAQIVQIVVGIVAAAYFRSAWAIVTSMLAGSLFRSAASYTIFPDARRRFNFDRAVSSELWQFSRVIAASSMLTLALAQVDKLVLARLFSLVQFGTYVIASNLASAPTAIVGLYVGRILYPQIARCWREDPASIRTSFYASRGIVFFGYLVAAGGLIGSGPLLIRLLYDPRYAGAGSYLQLLAIAAAMQMLTRTIQEGMVAIGRTRTTLLMNVYRIVWLAIAGPAGFVAFGAIGLIATLAFIEVPAYAYGIWIMHRIRLLSFRREAFAFALILLGAAAGLALQFLVDQLMHWYLA